MDLKVSTQYSAQTSKNTHSFIVTHGGFSKTDHILGNKINLYKFMMIEIDPCILCDHNAIRLKTDSKQLSSK